jgi:hypothetical protein
MRAFVQIVAISLTSILFGSVALPQEGLPQPKDDNLYSVALFSSLAEMQKSWGHIDDSKALNQVPTDYHHMPVEEAFGITDQLPSDHDGFHVEYLDIRAQIARCREVRKSFAIVRIHPMQYNGARLKVFISVSWLTFRKSKLAYGYSDWSDVEFRYDCEKKTFVLASVKLGGI